MRKKILFLGGSNFQLPPIRYAKQQGHYIITCDYLPENPGHQLADEYHNVSTVDKEAVLELAKRLKIDGIVSYASDPSAPTAAYVAEELKLPGNPYGAVLILSRKDLFRKFLSENNFNVPRHASFSFLEELREYFLQQNGMIMVKPVDSSGSKGVTKVLNADDLSAAFDLAMSYSNAKRVIAEEFIERKGYQIAGDGFVLNGRLVFRCFAQEHFNKVGNPHVPIGESFPLQLGSARQNAVHNEVDRLMQLLKMRVSGLNFDIIIDKNDRIFLMEIGGRCGGHLISEVIKYTTGTDLSKYVVDGALGMGCDDLKMYVSSACYSCYVLHSQEEGYFESVFIDDEIMDKVIEQFLFIKEGDLIKPFVNASFLIGEVILRFDSGEEMLRTMESIGDKIKIRLITK
jgi:biotin carboxylase